MTTKFCLGNNKGIIYLEVLDVCEVIILKLIVDNWGCNMVDYIELAAYIQ
jgi:hypothetical protein